MRLVSWVIRPRECGYVLTQTNAELGGGFDHIFQKLALVHGQRWLLLW